MRALLVEDLDAVGSAACDAETHAAALRAAGWTVHTTIVGPAAEGADAALAPPGPQPLTRDASLGAGLADAVRRARADAVFVASAAPGGGDVGARLRDAARAWWWPTAFTVSPDASGALESLPGDARLDPTALAVAEVPRGGRGLLPLWDGDFVLSPGPLQGDAGRIALEAFARLDDEWSAVDFVVLAHPDAEFESTARRLGVGARVHFAGPATRGAEHAWLNSTSALLLGGNAPLSGGLVLRALACGAPLLPCGANGVPGAVRERVSFLGCAPLAAHTLDEAARALTRALSRDVLTEQSRNAGRRVAAEFGADTLAARAIACLHVVRPQRRAA